MLWPNDKAAGGASKRIIAHCWGSAVTCAREHHLRSRAVRPYPSLGRAAKSTRAMHRRVASRGDACATCHAANSGFKSSSRVTERPTERGGGARGPAAAAAAAAPTRQELRHLEEPPLLQHGVV